MQVTTTGVNIGRVVKLALAVQRLSMTGGYSSIEWSAALYLLLGLGTCNKVPDFESPVEIGEFIQGVSMKVAAAFAEGRVH